MTRKLILALVSVGVIVILAAFTVPMGSTLEQQALDLRYTLRGPLAVDTNVVILYFDNDDIAALGGYPLRRNYYALLIDMLDQLGAAAIGIDVFFGERNLEYTEYDALLAATAKKSGKVVFTSYFRQLSSRATPLVSQTIPDRFLYTIPEGGLAGEQFQVPLPEFVESAAGIGHSSFLETSPRLLPLFVRLDGKAVAALPVELLRQYFKVGPEEVRIDRGVAFGPPPYRFRISANADGVVHLNIPGPFSSFRTYRSVEVLRSFQQQRAGLEPALDLSTLKNKIVLIGIVGEGRSTFLSTPYSPLFPAIALHATAIDNALNDRFLREVGQLYGGVLSLFLGLLVSALAYRYDELKSGLGTLALIIGYLGLSQWLFGTWGIVLPAVQPLLVMAAALVLTVVYEHRRVKDRIAALESEKALVEAELRARELKLQILERELHEASRKKDEERETKLAEEIQKYKRDIKKLTTRVTDLVEFEPAESQRSEVAEYEGILYDRTGSMAEVVQLIEKIASSDANVLILGESGTGKELVARAIHRRSTRRERPFVAINCGAIPETLLESELFGHEKGAFTGAVQEKIGRFEYADGGTIFLDEVAETSEAFQVKLLRVVQSGEFERVGSSVTRKANVRILAATNKDVKQLLKEKKFREDLYYRLNVFTVQLPPLRERKGDIPLLAQHFVSRADGQRALSSTVIDAFLQYPWPGNVRELESAITRAVILAQADGRKLLRLQDLPEEIVASMESKTDLEDQIVRILREKKFSRNSISEAAQELGGLNRGTVAEYFRGTCFKYFLENSWELERTVRLLSNSSDPGVNARVRKKIVEYLSNVVEGLSVGAAFEELRPKLRPKYKNLPQRYHPVLDEVIRAFLQGKWTIDSKHAPESFVQENS